MTMNPTDAGLVESAIGAERLARRRGRFRYTPSILPGLTQAMDVAAFIVAAFVAVLFVDGVFIEHSKTCWFSTVFVPFVYVLFSKRFDLYSVDAIMRPISRSDDVIVLVFTVFFLLASILLSLKEIEELPVRWHFIFAGFALFFLVFFRLLLCWVCVRLSNQKLMGNRMVVLGVGEQSRQFVRHLARTNPYFLELDGVFWHLSDSSDDRIEDVPVLGGVDDLFARARAGEVDDIVVAMPWNADRQVTETVEQLKELPVNVYLSTDLVGYDLAFSPVIGNLTKLPMFEVIQRPISGWSALLKTIEDYVLAALLLILISPILLVVALAIKLESPGPVFFMQKRLGFNNKEFRIYKFRSMYHNHERAHEVRQAVKGDPRVTRIGRIIRATSIDELPQLLNVLDGTMSLVGPRPHALSHNVEYGQQIRGYFARHRVKPGITGWAQVNGLRGETEVLEKMEERIRHDIHYAENWSLFFDLKILFLTGVTVLFHKTAY